MGKLAGFSFYLADLFCIYTDNYTGNGDEEPPFIFWLDLPGIADMERGKYLVGM